MRVSMCLYMCVCVQVYECVFVCVCCMWGGGGERAVHVESLATGTEVGTCGICGIFVRVCFGGMIGEVSSACGVPDH